MAKTQEPEDVSDANGIKLAARLELRRHPSRLGHLQDPDQRRAALSVADRAEKLGLSAFILGILEEPLRLWAEKPRNSTIRCHLFLSEFLNVAFSGCSRTSHAESIADRHYPIRKFTGLRSSPKETIMKEWLKPEITKSEAGMEVTSYLPAELDRA